MRVVAGVLERLATTFEGILMDALRAKTTAAEPREVMRIGDKWYLTYGGYLMGEIQEPTDSISIEYQLVPVDPTDQMLDAMNKFALCVGDIAQGYKAMLASAPKLPTGKTPVFWYRPCCNGEMYEGPRHNSQMDETMKTSGDWVPLYEDKVTLAL